MASGFLSPLSWVDYKDKSINIDQWDAITYDWNADIPYIAQYSVQMGPAVDNSPVTMVHWTASATLMFDPMGHWRRCLDVMIHL